MPGYAYVAHNPNALKNLYKIGFTTRSVEQRINELSRGVPYDLKEFHSQVFTQPQRAEGIIHEHLKAYRVDDKEWFRLAPRQKNLIFEAFELAKTTIEAEGAVDDDVFEDGDAGDMSEDEADNDDSDYQPSDDEEEDDAAGEQDDGDDEMDDGETDQEDDEDEDDEGEEEAEESEAEESEDDEEDEETEESEEDEDTDEEEDEDYEGESETEGDETDTDMEVDE